MLLAVVGIQYPSIMELAHKILVKAVYPSRTRLLGPIRWGHDRIAVPKAAGFQDRESHIRAKISISFGFGGRCRLQRTRVSRV